MKTFELEQLDRVKISIAVLTLISIILGSIFYFIDDIESLINTFGGKILGFTGLMIFLPLAILGNKISRTRSSISIDQNKMVVSKKNNAMISIRLSNLSMIRVKINTAGMLNLDFILKDGSKTVSLNHCLITKTQNTKQLADQIIKAIQEELPLVKANERTADAAGVNYSVNYINLAKVNNFH